MTHFTYTFHTYKIGLYHVPLAALEIPMWTRLASHTEKSFCLTSPGQDQPGESLVWFPCPMSHNQRFLRCVSWQSTARRDECLPLPDVYHQDSWSILIFLNFCFVYWCSPHIGLVFAEARRGSPIGLELVGCELAYGCWALNSCLPFKNSTINRTVFPALLLLSYNLLH